MKKKKNFNIIWYGTTIALSLTIFALIIGVINNNLKIKVIEQTQNDTADTQQSAAEASTDGRQDTTRDGGQTNADLATTRNAGSDSDPSTVNDTTEHEKPKDKDNPPPPDDGKPKDERKVVYLTFDDGPSERTPEILKILDKYNIKATFFVIYHEGTEDWLRDIVAQGSVIGLHAYKHNYSEIYKSEDAFFEDLQKISDFVKQTTGVKSMITRFPGGGSNTVSKKYKSGIMTSLTEQITTVGYQYFDWNCDSGDASGNNIAASTLVSRVKNGISSSAKEVCVLMHDASAKKTTVEALPQIIEYFQQNGYEFGVLTVNTTGFHHGVNN